uniref:Prepilin-type cleavage/methylation-like protein n=1 Tax=Rhodopseudomonas palustris (strain BisA53) TaxID=316055 RepID=Q07N88_RHOP5
MSKSFPAIAETRAGFMLMEVLVALAVAAMLFTVVAHVFANAWSGSRVPMELVNALNLARHLASEADIGDRGVPRDGNAGRFTYTATKFPLSVTTRATRLAPAPGGVDNLDQLRRAIGEVPYLRRVTIIVRTPSGRSLTYESVVLEKAG